MAPKPSWRTIEFQIEQEIIEWGPGSHLRYLGMFPLASITKRLVPASAFRPHDWAKVNGIMAAMRRGSPVPPGTITKHGNEIILLDGNHRHEAAKMLGITEGPMLYRPHRLWDVMTETMKKPKNKLSGLGTLKPEDFDEYVRMVRLEVPREYPRLLTLAKRLFPRAKIFDVRLGGSYAPDARRPPTPNSDVDLIVSYATNMIPDLVKAQLQGKLFGAGGVYDVIPRLVKHPEFFYKKDGGNDGSGSLGDLGVQDPEALKRKLRALINDRAASPGEKENAQKILDRLEKRKVTARSIGKKPQGRGKAKKSQALWVLRTFIVSDEKSSYYNEDVSDPSMRWDSRDNATVFTGTERDAFMKTGVYKDMAQFRVFWERITPEPVQAGRYVLRRSGFFANVSANNITAEAHSYFGGDPASGAYQNWKGSWRTMSNSFSWGNRKQATIFSAAQVEMFMRTDYFKEMTKGTNLYWEAVDNSLEPAELLEVVQAKLHPRRFPGMSPFMAAIVGGILNLDITRPRLDKFIVTSDGFVLGHAFGELGYNHFLSDYSELRGNWVKLLDAATDLSEQEREFAEELFEKAIKYGDGE